MTEYLSKKLKIVSLLLMIMVVFLHSYNIDTKQGGKVLLFTKGYNWVVQNFISNGITRIAVPLFFIISGFLFVHNNKNTVSDFVVKIKKRVYTLVIPFLIWSLSGILLYYLLQTFPQSKPFFTNKLIAEYNFKDWLNAIFYEPVPYQLWFLRDLIVLVAISPIVYFVVKKAGALCLFAIAVFWALNQDTVFLTSEALLFFCAGMFIHFQKKRQIKYKPIPILLLWLILVSLKTAIGYYDYSAAIQLLFLKTSILAGLAACWMMYDYLSSKGIQFKIFYKYSGYSFFIYVFHEPLLTIVKKGLFFITGTSQSNYFFIYFAAPLFVILACILTAKIIKSILPGIYKIVTGSR